ncbi:CAP domain-containing protein [Hyphomicrobium sp.]|uniref:CAP domain-containing protein n=1 Tax=Hyphomicrobium sp. TaxID=82 RepID=UPI001DD166D9|nr:CAP domain-containing protein [Hyphomicrobium sp.]MBY0561878.1 CAP domain-containing protein [Hyphomicrobium sp.]
MAALVPDLPQVEQHIVDLTNKARQEQKQPALKINALLAKAARAYAERVARSGTFSHTADGRTPAQRAESAGYKHCDIAENLAMDQDSQGFDTGALALQAVAGWMNSPPHRANIMRASVTEIGVGVARAPGPKPKFIAVELFGRPQTEIYSFKLFNLSNTGVSYSFDGKTRDLKPNTSVSITACSPGELVLSKQGGWFSETAEIGRTRPENKKVYTLKSSATGGTTLEISAPRQTP